LFFFAVDEDPDKTGKGGDYCGCSTDVVSNIFTIPDQEKPAGDYQKCDNKSQCLT